MEAAVARAEAVLSHISAADDKVGPVGALGKPTAYAGLHNLLQAPHIFRSALDLLAASLQSDLATET